MQIVQLKKVSLSFGHDPILDQVTLSIKKREKIGLIGRNGTGKSTLLKLLMREIEPDLGEIWIQPGLKVGRLAQNLPKATGQTVYEFVGNGIEHAYRIQSILDQFELAGENKLSSLSGGWQRRAVLARALVQAPDLLLLDEPTNHLDLEAIEWLEKWLLAFKGTLILITHDRALLKKVDDIILELDRGQITRFKGRYEKFLEMRSHDLVVEQTHANLFDKKLAKEEAWIRQGVKARRTRNEGRVRALLKLRKIRAARAQQLANPKFQIAQSDFSGKLVLEAEQIQHQFTQTPLIQDFSIKIFRGDKIALIGPNGCGKTTLIHILLKKLMPNQGKVKHGTLLEIAYFDQLRAQIDPNLSAMDNIAEGRTSIDINGKSQHPISVLKTFLFSPERARLKVGRLSGGEYNRLLLAKLFSKPSNFLVLDEPTNDLDLESLELLEDLLLQYPGTVLLVSHDREFVDRVATQSLIFTEGGKLQEIIGGFSDWLNYKKQNKNTEKQSEKQLAKKLDTKLKQKKSKKLSYLEKKELAALPEVIEDLEQHIAKIQIFIQTDEFQQKSKTEKSMILKDLKNQEALLDEKLNRWEALDRGC